MRHATRAAGETLKRFRLLSEALGFDADEVLSEFAEEWLERARRAVREPQGRVSAKTREAVSLMLAQDGAGVDVEEDDTRAMGLIRQTADVRIGS